MISRVSIGIHAMLERHLPEQRLVLKSDDGTRLIRLRPATQAGLLGGLGLIVGWTIIVTSFFLIDTISAGNVREQAQLEERRVQERLSELEAELMARAADEHEARQVAPSGEAQPPEIQETSGALVFRVRGQVQHVVLFRSIGRRDVLVVAGRIHDIDGGQANAAAVLRIASNNAVAFASP